MGFAEKLEGAVYGTAIGDAMGAPVEGWPPERIRETFPDHDFKTFLPPTHGGDPSAGKGNGRITDDTLMTEALIRAYGECGDHLDAYGFRDYFIPQFAEKEVWVPERRSRMVLLDRLNPIERYTVSRLGPFGAYPRHAGIGNAINCGVAMYIMPVGAVNAGDPWRAFHEAVSLAMAETDSYAVEAAGVLAGGYARAFRRETCIDDVCREGLRFSRDGTRAALEAVLPISEAADSLEEFIRGTREAFRFFDPKSCWGGEGSKFSRRHEPSRRLSIEEVPIAFAALRYGNGDFTKTMRAAVCYGRDCDSIGGMACGLYGAIFGVDSIPAELREESDRANQRRFGEIARAFEQTVRRIRGRDAAAFRSRCEALDNEAQGQDC